MEENIFESILADTYNLVGINLSNNGLEDDHQVLMLERKTRRQSREEIQEKISE